MGKFIQYCTGASLYDGTFDSSGWPAAGMGYIIVTESGRLIVVDGGFGSDAEALLALMEEQSGGKKPEAALWIITHPHMDHYGAIQAIGRNPALADRVRIGKIVYRFPMEFADKRKPNGNQSKTGQVIRHRQGQGDLRCDSGR